MRPSSAPNRLDEVEEKIRGVRDGARIVRTTRCLVPLPLILGVGLFQSDQELFDQPDHFHVTADRFDAVSFEADRPFDVDKFQHFLEHISNNVFRAKGLLWIDESDRRYVFHLVGRRFELDETQENRAEEQSTGLIGRNLDRRRLQTELEACLATPSSDASTDDARCAAQRRLKRPGVSGSGRRARYVAFDAGGSIQPILPSGRR